MMEFSDIEEETALLSSSRCDATDETKAPRTPDRKDHDQRQTTAIKIFNDEDRMQKTHDVEYRRKFFRSICMCLIMVCAGMVSSQLGPALLDLQLITSTTVQQASAFLTAGSAGDVLGSLLSGIVYDHLSKTLLPIASLQMMGLMFLAIPFCSRYWLMVSACFVLFASRNGVTVVASADILRMWGAHATIFMHAIHFAFVVGALVAPLITEPFLAPRNQTAADHYNYSTPTGHNRTRVLELADSDVDMDSNLPEQSNVGSVSGHNTQINFAFLISSILCFLFSISLIVDYIMVRFGRVKQTSRHFLNDTGKSCEITGRVCSKKKYENQDASQKSVKEQKPLSDLSVVTHIALAIWVMVFYFIFVGCRLMIWEYLTTFAVLQMDWSKSRGVFLSFAYWFSVTFSRLVSIFLAKRLTCMQQLVMSLVLFIPSLVGFIIAALNLLDWGVWLSTVLCGISLAPMYANALSWVNARLVPLTGKMTSFADMAAGLGRLATFAVQGALIGNHGALWFAYILLIEAILSCFMLFSLFLFSRLYMQPKYGARFKGEE